MGGRSSKPVHRRRPSSKAARQPSTFRHAHPSADTSAATSSLAEEPTTADANRRSTRTSTSTALLDLGGDVLVEVLSYLGGGRIEQGAAALQMQGRISPAIAPHVPPSNSCLTRTVPLINKQLRHLCDASDVLWMSILKRMLRSDPSGWEESVLALVEGRYHLPKITATSVQSTTVYSSAFGDVASSPPWAIHGEDSPLWRFRVRFQGRKLSSLSGRGEELGHYVDLLCQIVGYRRRMKKEHERKEAMQGIDKGGCEQISDSKHAVVHLALSRKVHTLPLLHIPTPSRLLRIGQITRLDASDPRHRQTLTVITTGQRRRDLRCGVPLGAPRPRFVLYYSRNAITANVNGGRAGAHLVELHRCQMQQSGRQADLFVVPIERVRIIETEEREAEDGITDASFQLDFSHPR